MTKQTRVAAIAAVVGGVLAAATSASAALNLPTQSCSYTFSANLKRGMTNSEVMNLQKVLNMYPQTQIASSGAGSPGMETNFFGAATHNAVVKFQELHAAEVLTPAGLKKGTGNVFGLTRAMLNQVCSGSATNPTNPSNPTAPVTGPMSVTTSASQPNNTLVAGQVGATLGNFVFSGNGTVTQVQLTRTGVSSNDLLTNVYLYDGATRLTDGSSPNTNGVINFSMSSGIFAVAGSKTITVKADIATGNTLQNVGVMVSGYNTLGGTMVKTAAQGNNLPVSSVELAGFTMNTQSALANNSVNAPQSNFTVWGTSANVSKRAVTLKGLTLKMIGSAPVSAVSNVTLYVDGVVAGTAMADANQRFVFTPNRSLDTGSHTVEVRADIVGGANRNFYFSAENASDISLEDSNFAGVNVPVTNYGTYKNGGTMAINSASATSITVATDPSFTTTNVISNAVNTTIAKYRLTAYGEDTKIQFISVKSNKDISNVGLFVNGAQVGSSYNLTADTAREYSLGSNFIATAGTTYTVEVKADLVSAAGVIAAGTVNATLQDMAGIGQSSQNSFTNLDPNVTVRSLTIGGGLPIIGKTIGGVSGNIAANSTVKIGSFSIQGGSVEAINVRTLALSLTGTGSNDTQYLRTISNVTLTDETGATIGTPTGIAASNQSYNVNIPVAIGQTKRIDVTATIGAAANNDTIVPKLTVTYTGQSSNQTTTADEATGDTVTVKQIVVGTPTISSKVAARYVLGGSNQQVVVYNATSSNGTATINDMTFTVSGSGVQSLTINGSTANVIGSSAKFTGLNINVPTGNSGVNIPVTVNYTPAYIGSGTGVASGATNTIAWTGSKVTDASGNVTSTSTAFSLASNEMTIVTSAPTVTAVANSGTNVGVGTTNNVKLGSITVTADKAGDIVVGALSYSAAGPGTVTVSDVKVGGSTAQDKNGTNGTVTATTTTFTNGYRVTSGTSVTFDVFGSVANTGSTSGTTSVSLGAASAFKWSDDAGTAGTNRNGTLLSTNYAN